MRVPGRGLCAQDEHADLAPNEFAARFGGCLHDDERWQSTAESRSASPRSLSVAGRGRVDKTCAAPRGESCAARMSSRANERMGGGQRANAHAATVRLQATASRKLSRDRSEWECLQIAFGSDGASPPCVLKRCVAGPRLTGAPRGR